MLKAILLAATAASLALPASAAVILTFGQTSGTPIIATENGANTQTTLTATNAPIAITQIENGAPASAFFDLSATSVGAAQTLGSGAAQHFNGAFSITSATGGGGTNFLSGSFTDLVFGAGPGGALAVGAPPDTLTLTSSVIIDLSPPSAIGLGFANITPAFGIVGTSIGAFTSSVSGTFSASTPVSEPLGLALMGVGLLGLGMVRATRR